MIPLFAAYPKLAERLPYVSLCELPTPMKKLERLGQEMGLDHLYVKQDDLSGKLYGGNKPRKLEFLLGHALHVKAKCVLTFGPAGSNHALATAIYAQQVGLKSISMLMPQPNAHYVRVNLLMGHYCGAELHQERKILSLRLATVREVLRQKLRYGHSPLLIPVGGSSPLGVIGSVNAAFELKEQIVAGEIPEPDRIYVALGSGGTAVGLLLGVRAAGLKSRVISVRVAGEKWANVSRIGKLFHETNSMLCSLDSSFPEIRFAEKDIDIRHDFLGPGYALFTEQGMEAVTRAENTEGIKLDGTYTGKTFAALIDDVERPDLKDKVVLFWNTYNSRDLSRVIDAVDYRKLPRCFHRYFEEEVQPLERDY